MKQYKQLKFKSKLEDPIEKRRAAAEKENCNRPMQL
jgi:hypothetical protein